MSVMLGHIEATRTIGTEINEAGQKLLNTSFDVDLSTFLMVLGASLVRAADTMETRMRDQAGKASGDAS